MAEWVALFFLCTMTHEPVCVQVGAKEVPHLVPCEDFIVKFNKELEESKQIALLDDQAVLSVCVELPPDIGV